MLPCACCLPAKLRDGLAGAMMPTATRAAAEALKNAINSLLVSDRTRLYLLNLDNEGVPHHDVTGDLVFPVLFEVADPERAEAILNALTTPEMWTSLGSADGSPDGEVVRPGILDTSLWEGSGRT